MIRPLTRDWLTTSTWLWLKATLKSVLVPVSPQSNRVVNDGIETDHLEVERVGEELDVRADARCPGSVNGRLRVLKMRPSMRIR